MEPDYHERTAQRLEEKQLERYERSINKKSFWNDEYERKILIKITFYRKKSISYKTNDWAIDYGKTSSPSRKSRKGT